MIQRIESQNMLWVIDIGDKTPWDGIGYPDSADVKASLLENFEEVAALELYFTENSQPKESV